MIHSQQVFSNIHLRTKVEETNQMLSALQQITKSLESQITSKIDLSGLDAFQKVMAENAKNLNNAMAIWNRSILASVSPFHSLSKSIGINPFLNNPGFSYSKILLNSNLAKINDLLKESPFNNIDWERMVVERISAEENGEIILKQPDELESSQLSIKQGVENLISTFLGFDFVGKFKELPITDKVMYILTLLSFLQGMVSILTDVSNKQAVEETKVSIENLQKSLFEKIEQEVRPIYSSTLAKVDVDLMFVPKEDSQIIGLVYKGQKVTVVEIYHNYFHITYLDKDTCEPKAGYVLKKYFEIN
ncbi:SH3 domain-containing protein [Litoribacter alkaliphilus]|uniref:SH3 domain-containing protein n=1 Tax=Litoribacter ruber TaxID=702568 RepID=A0AAP2CHX6_9BACT|nr:SH3 domain-containing protein [Litoribacter alkaliphilus]MBS9525033.1 SH3 domain-containing protein [Litoribacter alkaliphilus]